MPATSSRATRLGRKTTRSNSSSRGCRTRCGHVGYAACGRASDRRLAADITQLLQRVGSSGGEGIDQLLEVVYAELRRQAARYLRRERRTTRLQPTALVNEAFMKLVDQRNVRWQNRAHFFGIAAQAMRRIVIDHARARQRVKRGGVQQVMTLDEAMIAAESRSIDVLALDEALNRLPPLTSVRPGSSSFATSPGSASRRRRK